MPPIENLAADRWILYLLECADGTYYAGITTNLVRRFQQHLNGKGARYTRAHRPHCVIASMKFSDRSAASRAEYALKQRKKGEKLAFFREHKAETEKRLEANAR